MIDLQKLDYTEFEILVGLLLIREGYEIISGPSRPGNRGPDYETVSPEKKSVLVEVKHFKRAPIGRHQLFQFAGDIDRYRQQKPNARGLLVVSATLKDSELAEIRFQLPNVEVWHGSTLTSLLSKHNDIEPMFQTTISAREQFHTQVEYLKTQSNTATDLTKKIKALPCGIGHWKEYERICTEILTYIFTPDLATPDIQSRSDDGLDIIDAIFAIRSNQPPWALVRSEYRTRFIVAEFKNYCDPIGQSQVESIAQYLWSPAQRFFGLLLSRQNPSANALAQRRRKWLEEQKCIVFLNDDDLAEMLQLRQSSSEPFDVIDNQLEDFFRTLTP
jgi:hypothetical protein